MMTLAVALGHQNWKWHDCTVPGSGIRAPAVADWHTDSGIVLADWQWYHVGVGSSKRQAGGIVFLLFFLLGSGPEGADDLCFHT